MRMLTTATTLVLLGAGAAAAQSYPHAFPRPGVTKILENDRVVVWDSRWPPDVEQEFHEHEFDLTGVFPRWGPIRITDPDGTVRESSEPFQVPRPFFQARGVTHKEEGIGPPVRHSISVDLKEHRSPELSPRTDLPPVFPREGAERLVDNDRVAIWDHTWKPGGDLSTHVHGRDAVIVFVNRDPATLLVRDEDGSEERLTVSYGDVRFWPGNRTRAEEAVAGAPRAMILELK